MRTSRAQTNVNVTARVNMAKSANISPSTTRTCASALPFSNPCSLENQGTQGNHRMVSNSNKIALSLAKRNMNYRLMRKSRFFSPKSTVSTVFVILFYKNFQIRTSQYSCQSSKRCNQTRCWWQKRKVERREGGLLHLSLVVDFQKEMQTFSQFITEPSGFYMSQHMLHSREYIVIVIIKLLPEMLACSGTSGTHWSLQSLLSTDPEPLGVLA